MNPCKNEMSEENIIRMYETIARIIGDREQLKIKVTVRKKAEDTQEDKEVV